MHPASWPCYAIWQALTLCVGMADWQLVFGLFFFAAFVVICLSVVGVQLLAGSLGSGSGYSGGLCCSDLVDMPRSNFETFSNALISTLQVMLNDGWKGIFLFYWSQEATTAAFFVVLFLVCRGILFNSLRAMMLVNFALDEDLKIPKQMEGFWRARQKLEENGAVRKIIDLALTREVADEAQMEESAEELAGDLVEELRRDEDPEHRSLWIFRANGHIRIAAATVETSSIFLGVQMLIISVSLTWMATKDEPGVFNHMGQIDDYVELAVLGIFATEALLKTISSGLVFKCGPSAPYLTVTHNLCDFVFLVTLILTNFQSFRDYCHSYSIEDNHLRIATGLGPIVGLMQLTSVRREVNAFLSTLPAVATVGVPLIFVILGFSLAGVELFANVMSECHCPPSIASNATVGGEKVSGWQYCVDGMAMDCNTTDVDDPCIEQLVPTIEILHQEDCTMRTTSDNRRFQWENPILTGSFDDAVEAAKALIKASTSGGTELLYALMDAAAIKGEMPSINNSAVSATVFLFVYHVFVTVFLLNLFFAVMGTSFATKTGSDLVTLTGQRWQACLDTLERFKPIFFVEDLYRPQQTSHLYRSRLFLYRHLRSRWFRLWSVTAVVLNSMLLALQHYPASEAYEQLAPLVHRIFLGWFLLGKLVHRIFLGWFLLGICTAPVHLQYFYVVSLLIHVLCLLCTNVGRGCA